MSDLLNSASLVMIPSGYKEDTVFSAIPTDGSGDLSFTRASNGTRINSAGLVEVCPWNLLTYSEEFNNAAWTKDASTISSNAINAPNGTLTADLLIPSTTSATDHRIRQSLPNSVGNFNYSVYVKSGGYNWVKLRSEANWANVNLSNGAIGFTSGVTPTVEILSDGWYRISFSVVNVSGGFAYVYPMNVNENSIDPSAWAGNGTSGVYLWGAQLNIGSTAKPYFPTTDRLNVPRLTYQNGGGGCPSLLLEKQSTNFAIYSQDLTQSVSFLTGGSVTDNNTTSPDGTQNADKFTVSSASSGHTGFYESPNGTNGSPFTASIFLKAGTGRYFLFRAMTDAYATRYGVTIDLQSGTILSTNTSGSPTGTASKIENFGNGWYRVSLTMNCINTQIAYVWAASNTATPSLDIYLDYSYTGNGTDSYYIWGMTLEKSSYPTSYIPTTSASATRVADACTKTGASALIGQSEGTIFLDFVINGQSVLANAINIYNNDFAANTISTVAITYSDGLITCQTFKGNGTFDAVTINASAYITGQRIKLAYRYKSGDFAVYVNGVQMGTSATTMTFNGTKSEIYLNALNVYYGYPDAVKYNEFVQFKTGLTNAELASLTTI